MNVIRKERLLNSLYKQCRCRTATSKEIYTRIQKDMGVIPPIDKEKQALELIREYKLTGKDLEATVHQLHEIMFPPPPPVPEGSGKMTEWNPHDT